MKQLVRLYLPIALIIAAVTAFVGISLTNSDMAGLETRENDQVKLGSQIISNFMQVPVDQLTGMTREPELNLATRLPLDKARPGVEGHLLTLLYRNPFYDQARWLDANGKELVRVKQGPDIPLAVPMSQLEDKSQRDYFKSAIALPPGAILMSALDLSVDRNAVEVPHKPVVRFGIRLSASQGQDCGILVVNAYAQGLLDQLVNITAGLDETLMLLNSQGYWLLAPDPQDAFAFALGELGRSFALRYPAEWARISNETSGQMLTASGLWTWTTIDPAAAFGGKVAAAEAWKLVTRVSEASLAAMAWERWWPLLLVAATALGLLLFGVYKYRQLWQLREAGAAERSLTTGKQLAERRLLLATEGANVGIWNWDLATNKLEWSDLCKSHLALPEGKDPEFDLFYAAMHPDDREGIKKKIEEAVAERRDYYAEYRIVHPDGSVRWIAAPGRVYAKPDGTLEGMGGVTFDITARKKAEEDLRKLNATLEQRVEERTSDLEAAQERFRLLAENASDVVLRADDNGNIEWITPSVVTRLGQTPEELVGKPLRNLVHPEDWDSIESLEAQLRKRTPASAEVRLRIGRDGYQWFSLSMQPLTDENGTVTGSAGGLRDIHREMQAREAIKAERERLKTTLDSLLDPHVLLQPVRDKTGQVSDFIYADANPAACEWIGKDRDYLLGRSLLELFPVIESTGLMQIYRDTAETGRKAVIDNFPFPVGDSTRRLDIRGVRVDDRVSFVWRDVTERHDAAEKMAASEERYRLLAVNSSDVVMRLDENETIVWVSPSLKAVLGWEVAELVGQHADSILADSDAKSQAYDAKVQTKKGHSVVKRGKVLAKDGSSHWTELHAGPYRDRDGKIAGIVASFRVIDAEVQSEQERLHQQEIITNERKHLADVIEGSDTGTWEWYVQTGALVINEVWAKLIGYTLEEIQPTSFETWEKFTHPDDVAKAKTMLEQCFRRETEVYECEIRMQHRNGDWIWLLDRGRVVEWTEDGKPLRMLGTHRDITANVKLRQQLQHQATTDVLTGLCNRREFETLAHRELSRAQRSGSTLSLLMLDIDKFKAINDSHGHDAGDAVLKMMARACAPHLREVDVLARIGGEEFAALLPDTPLGGARHVAERLRESLAAESVLLPNGISISITVSIGVAQHDGEAEEMPAWIKRADEALYRAKQGGRNQVCTA